MAKKKRVCKAFQTREQCESRCGARNVCRYFRNNEYTVEKRLRGMILHNLECISKEFIYDTVTVFH